MAKEQTRKSLKPIVATMAEPHVATPEAPTALSMPLHHPLVLDLDRTLIKTDLLFETFAAALHKNPFVIFSVVLWLLQGRAVLKRKLAEAASIDLESLPVNDAVLALANAEAKRGRIIVLATAADEILANRLARHFPMISQVFASDGNVNLKGATKADVLRKAFLGGFIYAGDCAVDLPIWQVASGIIAVNVDAPTMRTARAFNLPIVELTNKTSIASTILRAMRVKQWAKNILVFAPLGLAGQLLQPSAWATSALAFLALGCVASATYLVNDLFDLADDRRHWSKRRRPLASGDMPIRHAMFLSLALMAIGLTLALLAGPAVLAVIALYAMMTLCYSFQLKTIPILDVVVLAFLFTLRLFLGVVAISAVISAWLLIFSMALFLSLSLAKRHTELVRLVLNHKEPPRGRGYVARDEPLLLVLGVSSAMSAIVLFSLYLTAEAVRASTYTAPAFLWATPVLLLLWLGRVWLLSQRGELHDDPVAFALKDSYSLMMGAALCIAYALAAFGGHLPWIG